MCSSSFLEAMLLPVNYVINGHEYTIGYNLTDGIYPRCSTFMTTISKTMLWGKVLV
jgi:hypothetical protein